MFVLLVVLEVLLSPHVRSAGIGTSRDDDRAPSYADDDELHSDDDAGGRGRGHESSERHHNLFTLGPDLDASKVCGGGT